MKVKSKKELNDYIMGLIDQIDNGNASKEKASLILKAIKEVNSNNRNAISYSKLFDLAKRDSFFE